MSCSWKFVNVNDCDVSIFVDIEESSAIGAEPVRGAGLGRGLGGNLVGTGWSICCGAKYEVETGVLGFEAGRSFGTLEAITVRGPASPLALEWKPKCVWSVVC